jgi:hypothetical protein
MKALILFLMMVFVGADVHALNPEPVPVELQKETENSDIVHHGTCQTPQGVQICVVGYDKATEIVWVLLFNSQGVLFQVVEIKGDKHRVRWTHPSLLV